MNNKRGKIDIQKFKQEVKVSTEVKPAKITDIPEEVNSYVVSFGEGDESAEIEIFPPTAQKLQEAINNFQDQPNFEVVANIEAGNFHGKQVPVDIKTGKPIYLQPELSQYAKYILKNNGFFNFELNYMMGKEEGRKPHGIPNKIWQQATKEVGFRKENLSRGSNGKYTLKLTGKLKPIEKTTLEVKEGIGEVEGQRNIKKPLNLAIPSHNLPEKAISMMHEKEVNSVIRGTESIKKVKDKFNKLAKDVKRAEIPHSWDKRTHKQRKLLMEYHEAKEYLKKYMGFYDYWTGMSNVSPKLTRLEELKILTPHREAEYLEKYLKEVKKLISKGYDIKKEVIEKYPRLQKAVDARVRYEKGLRTSFGNKTEAVDYSTKDDYGFKVKRQDGTTITEKQIRTITLAAHEYEMVIGQIKDRIDHFDLTIAHTNGKYPFLTSGTCALYHPAERTITVGMVGIKSFAHELTHALDSMSGTAGESERTSITGYVRGSLGNYNEKLIKEAKKTWNGSKWQIQSDLKVSDNLTEEEKSRKIRLRIRLGPYWYRNEEVFARLVEELVAYRLDEMRIKGAFSEIAEGVGDYYSTPAYWSKENFEQLIPLIYEEIQRKIELIRGKIKTEPKVFGGAYKYERKFKGKAVEGSLRNLTEKSDK